MMQCPKCGAENRDGSNYCRYCALKLESAGYVPSVPPPDTPFADPYVDAYPSVRIDQPAPLPAPIPARPGRIERVCPRCGSFDIQIGRPPTWAIVCAAVGFLFICAFSLLFLLVKEPHRCLRCGLEFK